MFARQDASDRFPPLIEKLERLRDECLGTKKSREEENLDDFTRLKKAVNQTIKQIRTTLKRRDALFKTDPSHPQGLKLSAVCGKLLTELFGQAEQLQELQIAEAKKWKKKKDKPEGLETLLENRESIVRLTFLHIQECEMLHRRREAVEAEAAENKEALFEMKDVEPHETSGGSYGVVNLPDVSSFPDIEIADGFATQDENEKRINSMLDQVLDGVIDLKELAAEMGTAIKSSDLVITELDVEVAKTNVQLDNVNTRLRGILDKVRAPRKIIVDIIIVVLFLALVGLMIKVIKDRLD